MTCIDYLGLIPTILFFKIFSVFVSFKISFSVFHCRDEIFFAYDEKENWNILGRAIEQYPNVLYTHTADMIASRIKGI